MGDTSYRKLLTVNETRLGQGPFSSSLELLNLANTTSYEPGKPAARTPDDESKWTSKPRMSSTALGRRLATWTQQTLRSLRLLLPMAIGPWKNKEEQPKIALYTGWVSVLTGLLVHVLPLAACIALIYLNVRSYFVSTHISTLTFQFLAKLLELLAQASLGSAVFVYLRALYTGPESVPFGALFAGLQITKVSYLWSLEFAGVITSTKFRRIRRLVVLLLIPLNIILAAGMGPAFAIALTPTQGAFYNGSAEAWSNATEEQIFPSNIDPAVLVYNFSDNCSTGNCARYEWVAAMAVAQLDGLVDGLGAPTQEGNFDLTQDASSYREIRWNASISPEVLFAMVTIPSKAIAWSLSSLAQQSGSTLPSWPAADRNFTTTTRQPIVTANCTPASWLNSTSIQPEYSDRYWPDWTSPQYVLRSELLRSFNETRSSNETQSFHWIFIDHDDSVSQPPLQVEPSVLVFIHYPPYGLSSSFLAPFGLCAYTQAMAMFQIRHTNSPPAAMINIPAVWLNQTLPPLSTLVDEGLLDVPTSTFLATSIAISMAQWPIHKNSSSGWAGPGFATLPTGSSPNPSLQWLSSSAGDHVFFPGTENADRQGKYKLQMDVNSNGYGYQLNQTTKIIAIFILAAYCLYILAFVILMLTLNRVHSNSWDSIGELTALAIMSQPDDKLRNTSAGVETVALFKLPMNIRANENNHLEIFFEGDERSLNPGVVEKNKQYN